MEGKLSLKLHRSGISNLSDFLLNLETYLKISVIYTLHNFVIIVIE